MLSLTPSNPTASTRLIIVMGVSGSGKSTLAEKIAGHYGLLFLDADDFHSPESRARMASGVPLTDAMRAPWVQAIRDYLQARGGENCSCVLAFSGLRRAHRDQLRLAGLQTLFIFLHGNKDIIHQRMLDRTNHFMDPDLLDSQFDSLELPDQEPDIFPLDINALPEEQLQAVAEAINHLWPGLSQSN